MGASCSQSTTKALVHQLDENEEFQHDLLSGLPPNSTVALVGLTGCLCPFHLSHALALIEARAILMHEETMCPLLPDCFEMSVSTPPFDAVLGGVYFCSDQHVGKKMFVKGNAPLGLRDRVHLARLAMRDYPWVTVHETGCEGDTYELWKKLYPQLTFVRYHITGTDDCLKYKKWQGTQASRTFVVLRSADIDSPSNAQLFKTLHEEKVKLGEEVVLGPGLPNISSSEVRNALCKGNIALAKKLLHPDVLEWLRKFGPWAPP